MREYFKLFGFPVRDVVTGFVGIVESISFDLYGCVQAIVKPPVNEKGETQAGQWFDLKRLVATAKSPVIPVPDFFETVTAGKEIGGIEKPAQTSHPIR